jgi:hypothetical protein
MAGVQSKTPLAGIVSMTSDTTKALQDVEEPRFSTDRQIKPRITVSKNVETGTLLRIDNASHRVQVLLAE